MSRIQICALSGESRNIAIKLFRGLEQVFHRRAERRDRLISILRQLAKNTRCALDLIDLGTLIRCGF